MGVAQNLKLKTLQDKTLDTLKEIADALNGEAGIVNTLTQQIANAKTEAVQTAKADATSKAEAAQADAVKTGETIKLADGTVKDIYRLCVERENVQDNFTIDTSTIGTISRILRINGTLTQTSGVVESATGAVKFLVKNAAQFINAAFKTPDTEYNVLLFIEFIL